MLTAEKQSIVFKLIASSSPHAQIQPNPTFRRPWWDVSPPLFLSDPALPKAIKKFYLCHRRWLIGADRREGGISDRLFIDKHAVIKASFRLNPRIPLVLNVILVIKVRKWRPRPPCKTAIMDDDQWTTAEWCQSRSARQKQLAGKAASGEHLWPLRSWPL